jgi:hypothetical protein
MAKVASRVGLFDEFPGCLLHAKALFIAGLTPVHKSDCRSRCAFLPILDPGLVHAYPLRNVRLHKAQVERFFAQMVAQCLDFLGVSGRTNNYQAGQFQTARFRLREGGKER